MDTHIYVHINRPSLFSIKTMYKGLELTTWDLITYERACLWRMYNLPFSDTIDYFH